jgi:hypothetical protein
MIAIEFYDNLLFTKFKEFFIFYTNFTRLITLDDIEPHEINHIY